MSICEHSFYCVICVSSLSVLGLKKPCKLGNEKGLLEDEESSEEDEEVQEEHSDKPAVKVHLTPLELEGLWNLLGKLEDLPPNKKCIPSGIHNYQALVSHIKVLGVETCIFLVHIASVYL